MGRMWSRNIKISTNSEGACLEGRVAIITRERASSKKGGDAIGVGDRFRDRRGSLIDTE